MCVGTLEGSKENFWQGHSRSEWKLEVAGPALQLAACAGKCAVCVLSFEDGSVQMDFAKEYSGTAAVAPVGGEGGGEGVEAAAEACLVAIETHERAFLAELERQFENFDAVFRDLRRVLPVSRTKFARVADQLQRGGPPHGQPAQGPRARAGRGGGRLGLAGVSHRAPPAFPSAEDGRRACEVPGRMN